MSGWIQRWNQRQRIVAKAIIRGYVKKEHAGGVLGRREYMDYSHLLHHVASGDGTPQFCYQLL